MKYPTRVIAACLLMISGGQAFAQNGGFEDGNTNNWQLQTGTVTGNLNYTVGPLVGGEHFLQSSPATDPVSGLPIIDSGNHSLRIGDDNGGKTAAIASYTHNVQPGETKLYFNYHPVISNPNHRDKSQPGFSVIADDLTAGDQIMSSKFTAGGKDSEWVSKGDSEYKPWACQSVDIAGRAGHNVRLRFAALDCTEGGHGAHAYIDSISTNPDDVLKVDFSIAPTFCSGDDIIMDASATTGEEAYFVSIEPSDSSWGRPTPELEVMQWMPKGQQAGKLNLNKFYKSQGGKFQCDKHYRIKLAASNGCVSWKEKTELIYISCGPKVKAANMCVKAGDTIPLEDANDATVNWSYRGRPIGNGGMMWSTANHDGVFDMLDDGGSATLNWVATDGYGCTAKGTKRLDSGPPVISAACTDCCQTEWSVKASGPGVDGYQWSNGQSGPQTTFGQNGQHSVTATNACGSTSTSFEVGRTYNYDFTLIYPNALTPTSQGGGLNDDFIIYEYGMDAGDPDAYGGFYGYRLYVFDRWGTSHLVNEKLTDTSASCSTLKNGDIRWDGKINGQLVQQGVYTFKIDFLDCKNVKRDTDWRKINKDNSESGVMSSDAVTVLPDQDLSAVCGNTLSPSGTENGLQVCNGNNGISTATCLNQGHKTSLRSGRCLKLKTLYGQQYYRSDPISQTCPSFYQYVNKSYNGKVLCEAELTRKIKSKNCSKKGKTQYQGWCLMTQHTGWWRVRKIK